MNRIKILILLNDISRRSGGMSSALDFAETLYDLGFNVQIGLRGGHLFYLLRSLYKYRTKIPLGRIHTIPKDFGGFNFSIKSLFDLKSGENIISRFKFYIQAILGWLGQNKNNFTNLVSKSDIIFFAILLNEDIIKKIRNITTASLLCNHAGSPDVFKNLWLSKNNVFNIQDTDHNKYIRFCKLYDAIIFQAHDQSKDCYMHDSSLKSLCYVLSPSCQEKEVMSVKQEAGPYPADRLNIVCVGSLLPRKAQHLAINVFIKISESFPGLDLHFVGRGLETIYGMYLQKKSKEAKLEQRIHFHGHRKDYLRYMAHADIILQTSKFEGVSRILREAMLLRVPIISFAISGTTSILAQGEEAILIEPFKTDLMATAICELLLNRDYAHSIAMEAHKKYLINHSWVAYASNLYEMIIQINKKRHETPPIQ